MKILYTSDIHASPGHLFSMFDAAQAHNADAVIVGGDIVPHHLPEARASGELKAQALYLESVLIPAVKGFIERRATKVFLDMGNDDFICNRMLLENCRIDFLRLLHMQKHTLDEGVDIVGYMTVPPTPFYRKDWEKPDCVDFPYAAGNTVALDGVVTAGGRKEEVFIDLASNDTIESDLARLSESIDRPFVFVAHSPPYQTPLDVLDNGLHVGSLSIRRFIENWSRQGLLIAALHGHIHGSPNRSGSTHAVIEKTLCINPGQNEGPGASLRYVVLELSGHPQGPRMRIVHGPGS